MAIFPFVWRYISCCFRCIITSGCSGEVRIFKGFEDDDPVTYTPAAGQSLLAIAAKACSFTVAKTIYNMVEVLRC